jgi:hypothetical protein
MEEFKDDLCDVRVWSGDCEHPKSTSTGDRYLCEVCETIGGLDHAVIRAALPYVSGDYTKLY